MSEWYFLYMVFMLCLNNKYIHMKTNHGCCLLLSIHGSFLCTEGLARGFILKSMNRLFTWRLTHKVALVQNNSQGLQFCWFETTSLNQNDDDDNHLFTNLSKRASLRSMVKLITCPWVKVSINAAIVMEVY